MNLKRKLVLFTSFFTLTGCTLNFHKPNIIRSPKKINSNYVNITEDFLLLSQNIRDFSADFANLYNLSLTDTTKNSVISPFSLYSALAVAAAVTSNNTQEELLNALHTNIDLLSKEYGNIFKSSNVERSVNENSKYYKKEILTNSIWLDKSLGFNETTLDEIANNFYCYSMNADFKNKNLLTNKQMSSFVKEKTNNLISPDFNFSTDTLFTILNTLYLKSLWNMYSDNISLTDENYVFTNRDGSKENGKLFEKGYVTGKAINEEKYRAFFAETAAGDRLKFLVPNDGYSLDQIINTETIKLLNDSLFEGIDDENQVIYKTRTRFPGFKAENKMDAQDLLKQLGVNEFFTERCDVSNLTNNPAFCSSVEHVAKLEVTRKGIEGAAYTAVQMCGSAAPFDEYEIKYEDFIVDRAFYYVVSDHNNLPLFSGVCNKI